jgi:hypothetical protein
VLYDIGERWRLSAFRLEGEVIRKIVVRLGIPL